MLRTGAVAAVAALAIGGDAWAAAGWSPAGDLPAPVQRAEAVVLNDGRVLVVGGETTGGTALDTAHLFDPQTRTWAPAATLAMARTGHSATLLANGRVLVAGGFSGGGALTMAEVYTPATGVWTPGGVMAAQRGRHVAVRLANGRVLVAGGSSSPGPSAELASAAVYDPAANTWSVAAGMGIDRDDATAVLLPDGDVLVAGGVFTIPPTLPQPHASRYDAATGTWSTTPNLVLARAGADATLLADGRVLLAGNAGGASPSASELYDPVTDTWGGSASLVDAGPGLTVERLADGSVVAVGGGPSTAFERFDPVAGTWSAQAPMATAREAHASVALPDGRLLVIGGTDGGGDPLASTELWTPPTTRTAAGTTFAAKDVGVAGEQDVTVTAGPGAGLFVTGVTLGGADAADFAIVSDGCTDAPVAAGGSCVVRVRFTPGAAGARTATLTLDDNASGGAIALTGTGTAPKEEEKPPPVVEEKPTPQPAAPAPGPAPAAPAATPRQSPAPYVCVSRRSLALSAWLPARTRLRSGIVTVDGKRVARLTPRTRRVTIDLRGKPRGTYTVRLTARTAKGNRIELTRRYRTCERPGA